MEATQILMDEYCVIEWVPAVLEKAADQADMGKKPGLRNDRPGVKPRAQRYFGSIQDYSAIWSQAFSITKPRDCIPGACE
jgi:hypothetical protein